MPSCSSALSHLNAIGVISLITGLPLFGLGVYLSFGTTCPTRETCMGIIYFLYLTGALLIFAGLAIGVGSIPRCIGECAGRLRREGEIPYNEMASAEEGTSSPSSEGDLTGVYASTTRRPLLPSDSFDEDIEIV